MGNGKRKDSCFIRISNGYLMVDEKQFAVDQLREAKLFMQNFEEAIFACENDDDLLELEKFIGEMAALSPECDDTKIQSFYLN